MPTYAYRCSACSHEFDKFLPISQMAQTVTCPKCGGTATLLITGGNGLIFKGSGFYITDYKGKSSSNNGSNGKNKTTGKVASEKGSKTESDNK